MVEINKDPQGQRILDTARVMKLRRETQCTSLSGHHVRDQTHTHTHTHTQAHTGTAEMKTCEQKCYLCVYYVYL